MKLFSFLLRVSPGIVILAISAGVVSGISSAFLIALINSVITGHNIAGGTLIAAFVGLCLLLPVARFTSDYLLCNLGQKSIYQMRVRLNSRILAAPLRQLEEVGNHRLLATLIDDISVIINALLYVPLLCINVAVVVGCLVYLGWLSSTALMLVLCFLVLGLVSFQLPIRKGTALQKLAREGADSLFGHFRALVEGTKELKLHQARREAFIKDVLSPTAASLQRYNVASMTYFIMASSWVQVLFFIFTGVLLFVLPSFNTISRETVVAGIIIVLYMMSPLDNIMNTLSNLSRASVALEKVESLGLSLGRDALDKPSEPAAAIPRWGMLALDGVTHTYHREQENSSFMLGPIDLTIFPGELIFLTGGNGSGKTTLIKMLTGLYTPHSGEIRLDGEVVTEAGLERYRQHFSAVFSDFYLFETLLGMDALELDVRAQRYLSELHLDHKVKIRDGVLSTTALSQGQRKRLALLVACLEDRPVYVFDEWAADQDPKFKDIFYYELLPGLKAKGKTIIVISHDDRYYRIADRMIKLEDGHLTLDEQLAAPRLKAAGSTANQS
jgi:putative ATP-binding cassette transporter